MISQILVQKKFLIPIGCALFLLGVILNAPVEQQLNTTVKKSSPKKCLSSIPDLELNYFPLPSISSKSNFSLENKCTNLGTSINVTKFTFSNRGLSFSPLGLKFFGKIFLDGFKPIEIGLSVGLGELKVILDKTNISALLINQLTGEKVETDGELEIDLIAHISKNKLKELEVSITSDSLNLPAQMISGFNIPTIKLSPFLFSGKMNKKNDLEINSVNIGKKNQGLSIMGKGSISNIDKINKSNVDIVASMQLGEEVKREFSFINLLLGDPNENGEYNFNVSGKLTAPRVKSLN